MRKLKLVSNPDKKVLYEDAVNKFMYDRQPQAIYTMPDILMQSVEPATPAPPTLEITPEIMKKLSAEIIANLQGAEKQAEEDETRLKAEQVEARKKRDEEIAEVSVGVLRNLFPDGNIPVMNGMKSLGYTTDDGPMDAFNHWMKTGQESDDLVEYRAGGTKAAWKSGDDTLGGHTVPTGLLNRIVEKRDEVSIARIMGAETIPVTTDNLTIPVEDTKLTDFVITAEEVAWDEDEGNLSALAMTIYNYTKLQKVSKQLLADTGADLNKFFGSRWGRAAGLTENTYFIIGTGTGQPLGAMTGATVGQTLASASTITGAEINEAYYDLPQPYRAGAVFLTRDSTEQIIRGLTGNPFLYVNTPQGGTGKEGMDELLGQRMFSSQAVVAFAVNALVMLHGHWSYYAIGERQGMIVSRNDKLYEATGQVGFFVSFRNGGGVTIAEAFQSVKAAAA